MYRYQTFGSRFLAAIIDGWLISGTANFLIRYIVGYSYLASPTAELLKSGLFFAYSIFCHFRFGQTIGKKITNVKVVSYRDETKLIGFPGAVKRDIIGMLLAGLGFFLQSGNSGNHWTTNYLWLFSSLGWTLAELITMLFNNKRRAIHDFLAGSVVIDVKKYPGMEATTPVN